MIFGRKKRQSAQTDDERVDDVKGELSADDDSHTKPEHRDDEAKDRHAMEKHEAQWLAWDEEFDREDGPFDIDEVDLHADDIKRLDLGCIVVTPFPDMKMQISVNNQQVPQAIIVQDEHSAIEVALFGAPLRSAYVPEIRRELIAAASQQQGTRISMSKGPFGTEIRRAVPVQTQDGRQGVQITRTWLAEGPSWVLRGVVFGQAATEPENEDVTVTLEEFFANLVVRRGEQPIAPGTVIPFTLPEISNADETQSKE
ncbi:DUF3710 domain-containing protein [uncultured Tessaracoccus sp.]|uniref:DUF3710 domain-containing protein n=1 Tax=uncultured Tessaracoccus sp. TaxID=905023 RepID=UPI0026243DA0|nr:DUF3710 domain-containing protein [uncultured Tessaracoccus sp.]